MAKLFRGETNTKSDVLVRLIGDIVFIDDIAFPLIDVNVTYLSSTEITLYYKSYTLTIDKDDLCFQSVHDKLSASKRKIIVYASVGSFALLFIVALVLSSTNTIANSIPDEYFSHFFSDSQMDELFDGALCPVDQKKSRNIMNRLSIKHELKIYILETQMKNAFAFPPDKIIFTSALLKKLSDDEFYAILAHEIGHLHFKHYKPSLFRAIALDFFGIGLSSQFLKYFGSLLSVKYSRDAERESDEFAADLMIENELSLANNISAMNKITEDSDESKYLSFISTHPATSERIEYFNRRNDLIPLELSHSSDLVSFLLQSCSKTINEN